MATTVNFGASEGFLIGSFLSGSGQACASVPHRAGLGTFDPTKFKDRYEAALKQIVEAKRSGKPIEAPKPTTATKTSDVFEALRASLRDAGHKTSAKRRRETAKASRPRAKAAAGARPGSAQRKTG